MKLLRFILVTINVLAALGLVLSTLAGAVRPSQSIVPSLLAFGYAPLLAANALLALVWLLMRRWQALISIAAIVARWGFVGLFLQVGGTARTPDPAQHPRMATLMTYNVHQFQGREDNPAHSDSVAKGFLALADHYRPDILCLQEYAAPKTVRVTDSLVQRGYNHYYGAHTSSTGLPYGTVVFSRFPITYVNRIDSEKLLVELMHDSLRFRVCCMHMDSYRFDQSDRQELARISHGEVQPSSSRTMDKIKETILSHEAEWEQRLRPVVTGSSLPLVLAGDLNDIPSSWVYHQITRHLADAFCEQGNGMSTTYSGGLPHFRIDMIFHSKGLRALSYKRVRSPLSDHHAVLATLEAEP